MELRLNINRMNPAEYFASLGVLELVSERGPTLSHFSGDGNLVDFIVSAEDVTLPDLRTLTIEALPFPDPYTAPVLVGGMRLDWWLDVYKEQSNGLKLWSGTATPCSMLKNYQSLMTGAFDEKALNVSVMTKTKSCFNLDTRASRDALDAGYSQKDAGEKSVLYPFTEFLCAVGLQNFRPVMKPMQYFTWGRPILTNIAHVACRQEVPGLGSRGFEVSMKMVGQGLRQVDAVRSLQQPSVAAV
jgi:CRISPR-associated protein Csb3